MAQSYNNYNLYRQSRNSHLIYPTVVIMSILFSIQLFSIQPSLLENNENLLGTSLALFYNISSMNVTCITFRSMNSIMRFADSPVVESDRFRFFHRICLVEGETGWTGALADLIVLAFLSRSCSTADRFHNSRGDTDPLRTNDYHKRRQLFVRT